MANDSRRVSQLGIATTISSTDRVVVLTNPATSAQTQTISVSNLGRSIATNGLPFANSTQVGVVKIGKNINIDSAGAISVDDTITGVYHLTTVDATSYTVSSTDTIIFADPHSIASDITIILPSATALEGREILVKNISTTPGYKVRVTTVDGINNSTAELENPIIRNFAIYYDLIAEGEGETWIHNGTLWRHVATQRSAPIFYSSGNTYHQVVIQNANNGVNSSGDLVLYNDIGNYTDGTGPFIDMGINSTNYTNSTYSIGRQNDAYLFTDSNGNAGGNLAIGTAQNKSVVFHANGTTSDKLVMSVNSTSVTVNSNLVVLKTIRNSVSPLMTLDSVEIDLTKTVIKLTATDASLSPTAYHLADGYEGQIIYLVPGGGSRGGEYTGVNIDHYRLSNIDDVVEGATGVYWLPFKGQPYSAVVTLIFTDGHWNLPHSTFKQ